MGGEEDLLFGLDDDRNYTQEVPDIADVDAYQPQPEKPELSQSAINSRLRRIFTPTLKGNFKVSQEILKDWESGPKSQKRRQLEQIFAMCGYDPDAQHE